MDESDQAKPTVGKGQRPGKNPWRTPTGERRKEKEEPAKESARAGRGGWEARRGSLEVKKRKYFKDREIVSDTWGVGWGWRWGDGQAKGNQEMGTHSGI